MTHTRFLCSFLFLSLAFPGLLLAQERTEHRLDDGGVRELPQSGRYLTSRDRLILDRGIRVEHHPNHNPYHKWYAPTVASRCTPEDFLPCARVFWNQAHLPEFGEVYTAQVPTVVPLRGPGRDVFWAPELHCMTYDRHRGQQWASAPGLLCQTRQGEAPWHMQWVIGGSIEGLDEGVPGIYEGSITLTITSSRDTWDIEVPIRYELFQKESTCQVSVWGTASLTGLPANTEGKAGVEFVDQEAGPFGTIVLPELKLEEGFSSVKGASFSAATLTIVTTEAASTSTSIDIGGVRVGPDGDTEPWTHVVAYYRGVDLYRIVKGRSPSISGSGVYWDDRIDGYTAVLFLAGEIAIPENWGPSKYDGTSTISITCG